MTWLLKKRCEIQHSGMGEIAQRHKSKSVARDLASPNQNNTKGLDLFCDGGGLAPPVLSHRSSHVVHLSPCESARREDAKP